MRVHVIVGSIFLSFSLLGSSAAIAASVRVAPSTVTRGGFLRSAIRTLNIASVKECSLPFKNTPKSTSVILCTANAHGALDLWKGRSLDLSRPITRGEALQVVSALAEVKETADVSAFADVQGAALTQAAMNAVARHWMSPTSTTLFGTHTLLSETEKISFLSAVSSLAWKRMTVDTPTTPDGLPFQALQDAVWKIIQEDYLHADKVDKTDASYKSIEAIVESLKDPYSVFFRKDSADSFQSQIKGILDGGIGAHVDMKDGVLTIVAPIVGSPAAKAGLQPGDQVFEANGTSLGGLSLDKAITFIRGPKGTPVTLKIRRGTVDLSVTIVRDVVAIPELDVSWQGETAVVTLQQFGEQTDKTIRDTFAQIAAKHPRGIVLDLRNNPGGLLHSAVEVLSNFVPRGSPVVLIKSREGSEMTKTEDEPTISQETKLSLIINNGSASASEVVAGALKYWKRAVLIGVKSFGKGSVQEMVNFKEGEALKLTVATFGPPDGTEINGVGVLPDIEVTDPTMQMRRALELAR